ncbi:MAG: class I SAM-dependent methyltransferase [Acidobacteriota bacterium]
MERMLEATARAEEVHYWFRGLRRHAQQLLRAATQGQRLGHIVDCGAGTGRNLDWLGHFGFAVGVELTPVGLAVGRARGRRMVRGSVTALPFADATADLATSFDVLYCLDDASESMALREMWRVLKPGGLALVNVAALDILHGSHSTLTNEVRRYTRGRLKRRLERAGFNVERLTFTNMSLFPPALAVRTLERVTGRASDASEADLTVPPAPINHALNWMLAGEAAFLRVTNLPIGTSIMAVARK